MPVVKLEAIGDDRVERFREWKRYLDSIDGPGAGKRFFGDLGRARQWVAEITGLCSTYRFKRSFVNGEKDYSEANSIGSRGVYVFYPVREGRIYEINEPMSWKHDRRYFARFDGDQEIEMSESEVMEWLALHKSTATAASAGTEAAV